jgi:hypothetical protein
MAGPATWQDATSRLDPRDHPIGIVQRDPGDPPGEAFGPGPSIPVCPSVRSVSRRPDPENYRPIVSGQKP